MSVGNVDSKRVGVDEARSLAREVLERIPLPRRDAEFAAAHLISAELRGYPGHGLQRLLVIASMSDEFGRSDHNRPIIIKPGFALFDGQRRLGIPAIQDALAEASERLDDLATIAFGVQGYVGTTGSLGIYASQLSQRGVISILMCTSEASVAPHGSRRAVLGTNPIAIGFPGSPTSFCSDIATAAWSWGAIKRAAATGKTLPLGVVQTLDGMPSTDPNDAEKGSQLPTGGHKGYALGLAVELLCGPLIGAKAGRNAVSGTHGFFGVLVRVDAARSAIASNADAQALFGEIRAGPPTDPDIPIRIPGESAQLGEQTTRHFDVPQDLFDKLQELRKS
ncbi:MULTISPECIES: Ldh family oxidoreductase [unclassified Bradyrhizobium]|nr:MULTISPECIES: Ldh family oxidoreductase [unclassified Bradyrhizobium]